MNYFLFTLWYLFGCLGFYAWWSQEFKMDRISIILMLISGVLGPADWIVGWRIHGKFK